jgi:hypothetical protein
MEILVILVAQREQEAVVAEEEKSMIQSRGQRDSSRTRLATRRNRIRAAVLVIVVPTANSIAV